MQQIWKVLSNGKIFIKIFLFFVSKIFIFDPTNSNEMNLGNILSGMPFSDKAIGMGSTKVWFIHLIFVELGHKTFKEPQRTCLNSSKAVRLGPRQSCWLCWWPSKRSAYYNQNLETRSWPTYNADTVFQERVKFSSFLFSRSRKACKEVGKTNTS